MASVVEAASSSGRGSALRTVGQEPAHRTCALPESVRALLGAWLLARWATWAFAVALAIHAYEAAGPGAVGVVAAARMVPAALVAPLAGRLADRRDRSRLAMLATLAQAGALAALGAAMAAGASLVAVTALAGAAGAAATPTRPALQTLAPALARSPEQFARATGLWATLESLAFLAGSGGGGLAVGAAGTAAVVAGAAGLLALAALLCAHLPRTAAAPPLGAETQGGFERALGGARVLCRGSALRTPFLLFTAVIFVKGAADVAVVILAQRAFHAADGPGVLLAAWGAGGLAAGWLLLVLMRRRGYGLAIAAGGVALAAGLLVTASAGLAIGVVAMAPAGAGYALVTAGAAALVPRLADDAVIGRVYALFELPYAAAAAAGALLEPVLIALLGVRGSLAALGLAFGACTIASLGALRRLDASQEAAAGVRNAGARGTRLASSPVLRSPAPAACHAGGR